MFVRFIAACHLFFHTPVTCWLCLLLLLTLLDAYTTADMLTGVANACWNHYHYGGRAGLHYLPALAALPAMVVCKRGCARSDAELGSLVGLYRLAERCGRAFGLVCLISGAQLQHRFVHRVRFSSLHVADHSSVQFIHGSFLLRYIVISLALRVPYRDFMPGLGAWAL